MLVPSVARPKTQVWTENKKRDHRSISTFVFLYLLVAILIISITTLLCLAISEGHVRNLNRLKSLFFSILSWYKFHSTELAHHQYEKIEAFSVSNICFWHYYLTVRISLIGLKLLRWQMIVGQCFRNLNHLNFKHRDVHKYEHILS